MKERFTTRRYKDEKKYYNALFNKYRKYIEEGMYYQNSLGARYTDPRDYFMKKIQREREIHPRMTMYKIGSDAVYHSSSSNLIKDMEEQDMNKALREQIKSAGFKAVQMRDEKGRFLKNGTYHEFQTSSGTSYWFNNGNTLIYAIRRNSPDDMGQWFDFIPYEEYKKMFDQGVRF